MGRTAIITSCLICLVICYHQMTSVDAVVSYRGQRTGHSTTSTTSSTADADVANNRRPYRHRHHQRTHRRRTQMTSSSTPADDADDEEFSLSSRLSRPFGDVGFSINWQSVGANAWWHGPNVCVRTTESYDTRDEDDDDEGDVTYHHYHHLAMSTVCDDADTVYKCTMTRTYNGNTTRISRIYECCHGYTRTQDDQHGCTQREELSDILTTLANLNATQMITAADAAGLRSSLATDNITVFAPVNAAFDALTRDNSVQSNDNVVVITPQLMSMAHDLRRTVTSHLLPGFIRSADFDNDLVLDTTNMQTTIRLNVYHLRHKIMTANCRRLVSVDHSATNGVIHIVSEVLPPVTSSLAEIITNTPQLSQFARIVERVGLLEKLSEMFGGSRDLTIFAPSNYAFNRLPGSLRRQLFDRNDNDRCVTNLLLHHVVCHVVCSTAVESVAYTVNALGSRVNLTRHRENDDEEDDELRFNTAVVTSADLMATDGVVHVIDQVVVPNNALSLSEVAEKVGASSWLSLVHKAQMIDTLNQLRNYTLFLPTNEAFKALPVNVTQLWDDESTELRQMLESHVVANHRLNSHSFYNGLRLETINSEFINFNILHSFPFSDAQRSYVQCAAVVSPDIETCTGVIHIIDKVMLPPAGDILDILYAHSQFSRLVGLLKSISFAEAFQSDDIVTFFAPTNEAFSSLSDEQLQQLTGDPDTARLVIQHHIITGAMCCSAMSGTRWMFPHYEQTVNGHRLAVFRRHGQAKVDGVAIEACDYQAVNGLVHAVDQFLPSALRHHLHRRNPARRGRFHSDIWSVIGQL